MEARGGEPRPATDARGGEPRPPIPGGEPTEALGGEPRLKGEPRFAGFEANDCLIIGEAMDFLAA